MNISPFRGVEGAPDAEGEVAAPLGEVTPGEEEGAAGEEGPPRGDEDPGVAASSCLGEFKALASDRETLGRAPQGLWRRRGEAENEPPPEGPKWGPPFSLFLRKARGRGGGPPLAAATPRGGGPSIVGVSSLGFFSCCCGLLICCRSPADAHRVPAAPAIFFRGE